jgi:Caspase domain
MKWSLFFAFTFASLFGYSQDPVFVLNPEGHSARITHILLTKDNSTILTFSEDKSICFWDVETNRLLKKRWLDVGNGELGRIIDVDLSTKSNYLAIARINSEGKPVVNILDIHSDRVLGTVDGFSQELGFVRFDPNEKFVITGSLGVGSIKKEPIRLWKLPPLSKKPFRLETPSVQYEAGQIFDLDLYHGGNDLLLVSYSGNVSLKIVYDASAIPEYRFEKKKVMVKGVDHVRFVPALNKFFCARYNGRVALVDEKGVQETLVNRSNNWKVVEGDSLLSTIFVSRDNHWGLTTGEERGDSRTDFYEVYDLKEKRIVAKGPERFFAVQFLSDSVFIGATGTGLARYNFVSGKVNVISPSFFNQTGSGEIRYGFDNKISFANDTRVFDFENHELLTSGVDVNGFAKRKMSFAGRQMDVKNLRVTIEGKSYMVSPAEYAVVKATYLNSGNILATLREFTPSKGDLLLYNPERSIDYNLIVEAEYNGTIGLALGMAPSPVDNSPLFATSDRFDVISLWSEGGEFSWRFRDRLILWDFEGINLMFEGDGQRIGLSPSVEYGSYTGNLKKGDELISIGEFQAKSKDGVVRYLESLDPLVPLKIVVRRGKEEITSEVKLSKIKVFPPLVSFAPLNNNEWLCWTPQGYYASSAGGEKHGGWVISKGANEFAEFHPAYDFKKQFYRPELLKLIAKEGTFKKAVEIYNTQAEQPISGTGTFNEKLPPSISWINPISPDTLLSKNTIRLTARVNSSSSLQGAKILLNGRTILRRDQLSIRQERGLPQYLVSFDVDLPSLENTINIFAENENGSTVSEERVLRLKQLEVGIEKYKPNLYLLSVGVSGHSQPAYSLSFADRDASSISQMYEAQKGTLFKNVFARTLVNDQATRANILEAFYWLEQNATQKDVVIIFMASHGLNEKDKFYILPHDGDPERIRITGVDWLNFSDVLGNLPSKVLVFIDACHSGKLGTNLLAKRGETDLMEAIRALATEENGVVIMAASTGKESSFESEEWQHGAFTLALLEGMRDGKADLNEDGIINIREIDYYVAERVKVLTKGKQHPTTQKPSVVSEFPLLQISKQKDH